MFSSSRMVVLDRPRRAKIRLSRTAMEVAGARLSFLALVLVTWQLFAGGPRSWLPANVVGRPTSVATKVWSLVQSGELFPAWLVTVEHFLLAILIAAPLGVALGALTSFRAGRWLFDPVVTILYSIPKVALVPVFILVMGIGTKSYLAVIVSVTTFMYTYSTNQGFREIDHDRLVALRLMGASRAKLATALVFPSIVPQLFAATRIAIPHAFTAAIFAELVIPGSDGLGVLLRSYEAQVDGPGMMAVFLFIVGFAYLLDTVASALLARYTRATGAGAQL
jgi:NitT/TauT family transport system permease protein